MSKTVEFFTSLKCIFRRNVDCENKSDDEIEESSPAPSTTTASSSEEDNEDAAASGDGKKANKGQKEPQTLEEVLAAIKEAGNVYFRSVIACNLTYFSLVLTAYICKCYDLYFVVNMLSASRPIGGKG